MKNNAVIYARVSSEKQVREGNGLKSQEISCRQYCERNGYHVLKVFKDKGITGAKYEREAYLEMLEYLKAIGGKIILVVDDFSRLGRDIEVNARILRDMDLLDVRMESPAGRYESTPEGKVLFNMKTVLSQYQREANAKQVNDRMQARLLNGYRAVGSCALGYEPTECSGLHRPYIPVAPVIKQALEGYASGQFNSYVEVARFINSHQLKRRLTKQQIREGKKNSGEYIALDSDGVKDHVLDQAWYYAGFIENEKFGVTRRKGQHDAIISVETMELIEKRLRGERLPVYRKNINQYFPLRGHVLCPSCQKPMMGSFCGGRKQEYGYYYCQQFTCEMKNKNARYEVVHGEFEDLLMALQPKEELLERATAILKGVWKEELNRHGQQRAEWKRQLMALENQLEQYVEELVTNKDKSTREIIQRKINEFSREKAILERKVEDGRADDSDFETVLDTLINFLKNPLNLWKKGDLERKQLIQRMIFPEGLIFEIKGRKFRNPAKARVFAFIGELQPEKAGVVGPEGLEPPT